MNNYQPISEVGWIDFSDTDKQKVMKVIEMLQPDGTVDELGVGVIRNALSDAMFPGITTIMTRAKYFFIVPRILHSYISHPPANIKAREYLRQEENEVMYFLSKKYSFDENQRIIGVTVAKQNDQINKRQWKELIRKPSTIYWNGIRAFKIYPNELSLSNLLENITRKSVKSSIKTYQAAEGETSDDRDADLNDKFIFSLPDYDKNWKVDLSIELTNNEANFLKHHIIDQYPDCLIGRILKDENAAKDFLQANNYMEMCERPFIKSLPKENQDVIYTAKDFWHIMYGAHIRYNIILHNRHGSSEFLKGCHDKWEKWVLEMTSFNWSEYNRDLMWQITNQHSRIKPFTKNFINNWMDLIARLEFDPVELDRLVEQQELKNKTSRSKLRLQNDEKYNKWIGISNMDFRFGNSKVIIQDIVSQL